MGAAWRALGVAVAMTWLHPIGDKADWWAWLILLLLIIGAWWQPLAQEPREITPLDRCLSVEMAATDEAGNFDGDPASCHREGVE